VRLVVVVAAEKRLLVFLSWCHHLSLLSLQLNLESAKKNNNEKKKKPSLVLAGLAFSFSLGVLLQILVRRQRLEALERNTRRFRFRNLKTHHRKPEKKPRKLQLLKACSLWHNWWPLLTAFAYVLVPMPMLFFGPSDGGSVFFSSANAGDAGGGWGDAGKFLTGFSAVGCVAVPSVLHHAGLIAAGALGLQLAAVAVLGGTLAAAEWVSAQDRGGFYY
jgi:hypothetical protein